MPPNLVKRRTILAAAGLCGAGVPPLASGQIIQTWKMLLWNENTRTYTRTSYPRDLVGSIIFNGVQLTLDRLELFFRNNLSGFAWHSVARDSISRVAIIKLGTDYINLVTGNGERAPNLSILSVELGTRIANGILITVLQEAMQLYLRRARGVTEQRARWMAWGIAWSEIAAMGATFSHFFQGKMLEAADNVKSPPTSWSPPAEHPAHEDLRRRRLLEEVYLAGYDTTIFSFKGPILTQSNNFGTLTRHFDVSGTSLKGTQRYPYKLSFWETWIPLVGWRAERKYYAVWGPTALGIESGTFYIPDYLFD